MASRLIVRGSDIDYVNSNGETALHICVTNKLHTSIKFLLNRGAEPHIMDLKGEDACDKAKANGIIEDYKDFQNCSYRKKIIPMLPNGMHPQIKDLPFFKLEKEDKEKKMLDYMVSLKRK